MAKKNKFYVVWEGLDTGIFSSWSACQAQIKGYPNAKYAGFPTKAAAEYALDLGYFDYLESKGSRKKSASPTRIPLPEFPKGSWAVDAACSGNPGKMEYRGVYIEDGTEIFHLGPIDFGTNNIGEFLALVHALALLQKKQMPKTTIYSDSRIAMGWVKKKKCNTKLVKNNNTASLYNLIHRAELWLKNNTFNNPIIKWETKDWGEIPADFGRK